MPFVTGWRGLNERDRSSGRNQVCLEANGRLDQLEDRLSGTQEAGGSNPPASTNYSTAVIRRDDVRRGRARVHGCSIRALCDHDGYHPLPHTTVMLVLH